MFVVFINFHPPTPSPPRVCAPCASMAESTLVWRWRGVWDYYFERWQRILWIKIFDPQHRIGSVTCSVADLYPDPHVFAPSGLTSMDPDLDPALDRNENGSIQIHWSEAWIRRSGSTPKCHGSATLATCMRIRKLMSPINTFLYRTAAFGREDSPWCSHAQWESPDLRLCKFG